MGVLPYNTYLAIGFFLFMSVISFLNIFSQNNTYHFYFKMDDLLVEKHWKYITEPTQPSITS